MQKRTLRTSSIFSYEFKPGKMFHLRRRLSFNVLVLFLIMPYSLYAENPLELKLIIFEGSDWCPNCIRLEKTVLKDSAFIDFMHQNNISVERIDFPQHKKLETNRRLYNNQMAEKYVFRGSFPTILLVESRLNKVIEISYKNQNTGEFLRLIQSKIYSFK